MSSSPKWECDVFVSFKGDLVKPFTSGLFKRLDEVGIGYFGDDNREEAPEDFKGKRRKALEQVRFALVVFCESYVTSGCLNGQVELLKRKKDPKLVVIPIYYLTDRAVVSREFAEALQKRAGEISGYELQAANGENELKKLIDNIFERLVNEIHHRYPAKVFGPFGGEGGKLSRYGKINGIYLVYTDFIKSIAFEVEDGTVTEQRNGRNGEDSTYKVVEFEDGEYITSFAVCLDNVENRINGLTFRTNKNSLVGTFGKMKGQYFSVPSEGWKVIEFFVWGNGFLTSIGARVERDPKKFCPAIVQRVGLNGKKSGYKWDDGHHHANVRKIIGKCDSSSVQSIAFRYEEKDGKLWQSETHGRMDGNNFTTREIEMGRNEYLTAITAICEGDYIKSLEFVNGENEIKTISVDVENDGRGATSSTATPSDQKKRKTLQSNGKIVGFYGWRDERLYGIGAYFEMKPIREEVSGDDQIYFGVRRICLWLDKTADSTHIRGITFVYDDGIEKGKEIHCGDLSARDSCRKEECKLDYPREYLTSISGCTGKVNAIQSLTFHSNRKTYCPYAPVKEEGKCFWYPSTGSKITSFYATFGDNMLKSIGVYAEAIRRKYPLETIGPFGGTDGGDEWNDGVHTDVRAFRVSYDKHRLHSISFMYDDDGSMFEGPQRGGGDVGKWIWLDFPNERLTSITVWKVKVENGIERETIIGHLKITTTADTYGPYPSLPKGKLDGDEIKLYGDSEKNSLRYNMVGFFG